jgi:hypothetical protein
MTNTEELRRFSLWLQSLDVQLLGEDVNIDGLLARWADVAGTFEPDEEEPCPVRHTVCRACGLDVEVWLDDPELVARDRGGNKSCSLGTAGRHIPSLDGDDLELHRLLTEEDDLVG